MAYLDNIVHKGAVAVITGAASGIGLAAAKFYAHKGMKIFMADIDSTTLTSAVEQVKSISEVGEVASMKVDVSNLDQVIEMKDKVLEIWGEVSILMNNAASFGQAPVFSLTSPVKETNALFKHVLDINVGGVLNGSSVFGPIMAQQENYSVIINTGSKQGITTPPSAGGAAYNTSKAAVKVITEQLCHELRTTPGCKCSAHLFVPGWTHTGAGGNANSEKPSGAWSAEQTVSYMLDRLADGDFYIIVPDNEATPILDKLRMSWAAGDIIENRPALSRWHPAFKAKFDDYIRQGLGLASRSRSRGRAE